jgi:hypothetical protein
MNDQPGSSNAPADADPFGRNDDGTIKNPQPAHPDHVASAKAEAEKKPDAHADEPK